MKARWSTAGDSWFLRTTGKNVHLVWAASALGVLEPMQANPTIIEDNRFIGARLKSEGVIVEENLASFPWVYIGQSTKIYDRATGEVSYGRVPAGSVVVSGNLPSLVANTACIAPSSSNVSTHKHVQNQY